jgi:hypothetical protein
MMSMISTVCWGVAHHFCLISTPQLTPAIGMTLSLISAMCYAGVGDWGHFVYWGAAAVITFAATFMMGRV